MTFHAVCADCDDFEDVGDFDEVFEAGRDHEDETGHDVRGGRVEA
jgi:hypothetical protein